MKMVYAPTSHNRSVYGATTKPCTAWFCGRRGGYGENRANEEHAAMRRFFVGEEVHYTGGVTPAHQSRPHLL